MLGGPCARVLEADVRIRSKPLVLSDARDLVTQNPFLAASLAHDEMQPVAVYVPPSLGGLNAPFGQLPHIWSRIWSHTSTRIVAYDDGRWKTV
jgi:hypothetical protein